MEELNLIFELSVFVDSHCWVWWLRCDKFEEWVNTDTLHKLAMAFESLHFLVLALLDVPEDWGAIETAWDKVLRVVGPSNVNHITNVSSELSGVTPLDGLFNFAKLNRSHLQLPYNDHLVVAATSKVLAIGRETHHVDRCWVTSLQVILVLGLECFWVRCTRLLFFSGGLDGIWAKLRVLDLSQLPKANARVELVDLAACDEVLAIRVKVDGHDSGWLFVPAYLGNVYLHLYLCSIYVSLLALDCLLICYLLEISTNFSRLN